MKSERTMWMLALVALIGATLFVILTVFVKQEVRYAGTPSTQPASVTIYTTPPIEEPAPSLPPEVALQPELISEYNPEEKIIVPSPAPEVVEKETRSAPIEETIIITPREEVPVVPSPIVPSRFSEGDMLKAHNVVRRNTKLPLFSWSPTLVEGARVWAKVLKSEGCTYRHDPNLTVGENTFWSWLSISDGTGLVSTPKDAVTWWADEKKYYHYRTNTCDRGEDCGHYTQIVWSTTTEVGCAVETCLYDGGQADVWVCRYSPSGNVIGEWPY